MADLLKTGLQWLEDQRTTHLSGTITYQRGVDSVDLPATSGNTELEVETEFGVERYESRDFIVRTTDLVLGGWPVLPERGDVIRETVGGATYVYEVMAPGQSQVWKYTSPFRQAVRIHAKQISTE